NGTLSHYKARLIANGSIQIEGIDVDETFSLIVKLVQQVCLHMHDPQEPHFSALKRILRLGWLPYYLAIDFSWKGLIHLWRDFLLCYSTVVEFESKRESKFGKFTSSVLGVW
nr:ribonuclease H-like domain-containing protein [Tanacetum cinerariifolium]